jgi:hypothetical protein
MPVAGAVIGAVGAIGGSLLSSRSASRASSDASRSASDTAAADRELARETRAANAALFAPYLQDEALAKAYADALYFGEGTVRAGSSGVSRPMSEVEIQFAYPELYVQWSTQPRGPFGNRNWLTLQQFMQNNGVDTNVAGTNTPAQTITRQQVLDQIEGTPLAQLANTDFAAREDLADETYAGADALADGERNDLRGVGDENYTAATDLAGRARTGRRGVAQENLDSRLGEEENSYAAWLPISQQAERDAINLNFSRGGVTGLVGQTRAGVGETTQNAAMERNLLRMQGRQRALDPYYGDVTNAEDTYWSDQGSALDERGSTYLGAEELRGRRRQNNYAAYSGARSANYDQFAGDRLNAYADYAGFLNDRVARGGQARNNIAGFASDYASAATAANNRASQAAQAAHARQGQIQQQLYGDMADIAGNTYASIFNRNKSGGGSDKSGGGGMIYSSSVSGRGKYG